MAHRGKFIALFAAGVVVSVSIGVVVSTSVGEGEANVPRKKKKRTLSLISNILDDLGLNEVRQRLLVSIPAPSHRMHAFLLVTYAQQCLANQTQKALACGLLAAAIFGLRLLFGSKNSRDHCAYAKESPLSRLTARTFTATCHRAHNPKRQVCPHEIKGHS